MTETLVTSSTAAGILTSFADLGTSSTIETLTSFVQPSEIFYIKKKKKDYFRSDKTQHKLKLKLCQQAAQKEILRWNEGPPCASDAGDSSGHRSNLESNPFF